MRKLKVIQILPTLNTGGVERGVLDFNKYLVKKGHESYVISNGGRQVKNLIEDGGNHIHLQISNKSIFTLFQAKKLAAAQSGKHSIMFSTHASVHPPSWLTIFDFHGFTTIFKVFE